jgi:hypothetical protein
MGYSRGAYFLPPLIPNAPTGESLQYSRLHQSSRRLSDRVWAFAAAIVAGSLMGAFAAVGPRFVKLAHAAGSGPSPAAGATSGRVAGKSISRYARVRLS